MPVVPLATVKRFLNMTSTVNDDELLSTVEYAEAAISVRVGPLVPVSVVDEAHTANGPIVLRKRPIISVTSVTSAGSTVTDVEVDAEAGILIGTFYADYRATKVSYTAGWSPLPADLEAAVLELTAHLWRSQRGTSPSPLAPQGEEVAQSGGSYLFPYRVQSLIEPYLLPTRI